MALGLLYSCALTVAEAQSFSTTAMEGSYEVRGNGYYQSVAIIDWAESLTEKQPNRLAIVLRVLTKTGCTGNVSGFANATSDTRIVLNFKNQTETCRITLDFVRNQRDDGIDTVNVTEDACSDRHGMKCSFSGRLRRRVD